MVKNIIFDIGNVLTDFRWEDFLREKGFSDEWVERIGKATVMGPYWPELDRGIWNNEQLMKAFVELDPEIEEEIHKGFDDMHGMVTIREYAIPWIQELKEKGYGVYYLSNFSKRAEEECADCLAFLPYMDGGILSYKEKLVKPCPEIYQRLLEKCNLKAEECVFLDDTQVNVDAAKKEGIAAICFESKEQATLELRKMGVEI